MKKSILTMVRMNHIEHSLPVPGGPWIKDKVFGLDFKKEVAALS